MSSPPGLDLDADTYRRRIRVRTLESGPDGCVVFSEMEDDFHFFVVTLRHDNSTVLSVEAESKRWPWATCPSAAEPLRELAGMPLSDRFTAAARWRDPRLNCTHQFDTACYAITAAARGTTERVYDLEIPRRDTETGATRVRCWVDGELALEWHLTWEGMTDPQAPFDAAPWKGGFMRWADATLAPEEAEAAISLRRACDIGMGRAMDLDAIPIATELLPMQAGICHTMQPGVVEVALRNVGSIRDFAANPELLLDDPHR
jgi:hypothetical protein